MKSKVVVSPNGKVRHLELPDEHVESLRVEHQLSVNWLAHPERYIVPDDIRVGQVKLTSVGVEVEFGVFSLGAGTVNAEQAILALQSRPSSGNYKVVSEFANFMPEVITPPYAINSEIFMRLASSLLQGKAAVREYFENASQPCRTLSLGYFPISLSPQEFMTRNKPRYGAISRSLLRRTDEYKLSVKSKKGDAGKLLKLYFDGSPALAGRSCGLHINVGTNAHGLLGNAAVLLAPFEVLLGSTSRFVKDHPGPFCGRWIVWAHGMSRDRRLTPFALEHYFREPNLGAIVEWQEHISQFAEAIIPFDDTSDVRHDFSTTAHYESTVWNMVLRIRKGLSPDGLVKLRQEGRVFDEAFCLADTLGNIAFHLGASLGLMKLIEDVGDPNAIASFKAVKKATEQVACYGHADIKWMGKKLPLATIAGDFLLPLAFDGLTELGIPPLLARNLLGVVSRRLVTYGGSDYVFRSHRVLSQKHRGWSEQDIMKELMWLLACRQYEADTEVSIDGQTIGSLEGVADWTLLGV